MMAEDANLIGLQSLSEADWNRLISKIKDGQCTPIIGPGAYTKGFPWTPTIAMGWMQDYPDYPYPWDGSYELGRVAQFVSVVAPDPLVPKDAIAQQVRTLEAPDFKKPDEPHRVLASLDLPIYITTNYDNFMVQALKSKRAQDKDPVREFCHWNDYLEKTYPPIEFEDHPPTVANPVVYHMHGHEEYPDSLVLTYDDYLDFLVNISEENSLMPVRIQRAISGNSLLMLGYQLEDWNFRALFRSIVIFLQKGLKKTHVAVQLDPRLGDKATDEQIQRAQKYFNRYFETRNVKVYWGTCQDFVAELRERWNSPLFKPVDIENWTMVCAKLAQASQAVQPNPSRRIFEFLPAELQAVVSGASDTTNFALGKENSFVLAFNNILKRSDFFDAAMFEGVAISDETKDFLGRKDLSIQEVEKLNRLLFEASYPEALAKIGNRRLI